MSKPELEIVKGRGKLINGEYYLDSNAVYHMCIEALNDLNRSEEAKKNAKEIINFILRDGNLRFEPAES